MSGKDRRVGQADVTFTWQEDTDGPEADEYTLKLTGQTDWTGSATTHTFKGLEPGSFDASVTANNDAGMSEPATLSFTIEEGCKPAGAVGMLTLDEESAHSALQAAFNSVKSTWQGMSGVAQAAAIVAAAGAVALGVVAAVFTGGGSLVISGIGLSSLAGGTFALSAELGIRLGELLQQPISLKLSWTAPEEDDDHGPATSYFYSVHGSASGRQFESSTTEDTSVDISMSLEDWIAAESVTVVPLSDCGRGEPSSVDVTVGDEEITLGAEEECKPPPIPQNGNVSGGGGSPVVHISWSKGIAVKDLHGPTIGYVIEGDGEGVREDHWELLSSGAGNPYPPSADHGACGLLAKATARCGALTITLDPTTERTTQHRDPGLAPPAESVRKLRERVSTTITYDPIP